MEVSEDRLQMLAADCMADGIKLGFSAAIECLAEARAEVSEANQTWESAIAFLRLAEMSEITAFKINR